MELKNLHDVENLANTLMNVQFNYHNEYGSYLTRSASEIGYTFEWMSSKRTNGQCHYGRKKIRLSKQVMSENLHDYTTIRNTILHEIAHAFAGSGHGHNAHWRQIARTIGCDANRCSSYDNKPKGKYTLVCDSCGREAQMHRKPKYERSCGECSPRAYNPIYKMRLVQNY
jgi:hypothetical protein